MIVSGGKLGLVGVAAGVRASQSLPFLYDAAGMFVTPTLGQAIAAQENVPGSPLGLTAGAAANVFNNLVSTSFTTSVPGVAFLHPRLLYSTSGLTPAQRSTTTVDVSVALEVNGTMVVNFAGVRTTANHIDAIDNMHPVSLAAGTHTLTVDVSVALSAGGAGSCAFNGTAHVRGIFIPSG